MLNHNYRILSFRKSLERKKMSNSGDKKASNPLNELVQPFKDLIRAPRALWGVNISYLFEGMVYFGILGYLSMYFSGYIHLNESWSSMMVGVLTFGITLSMVIFGGLADKWGVRRAMLTALFLMIIGRSLISMVPYLGLGTGLVSPSLFIALGGMLFVIVGYGMYQPAAYAAIKQFTTPKTAAMGYAMLYALMNLGGWLPTFFAPIRKGIGINGSMWVFTSITIAGFILTYFILSKKIVEKAISDAKKGSSKESGDDEGKEEKKEVKVDDRPFSLMRWFKEHPLADPKFAFFIFALIPVQTLFAYNWLIIPKYISRAFAGTWIGTNFEVAVNFNPLLIFILVPIVTALTMKKKVYNMMVIGTFVMAAPAFLLVLGNNIYTLTGYILIMTIGEAMWQPRFLQYAAEIAPEGKTGAYMGVAQFPWFLTKVITSLYAGFFLSKYCPAGGPIKTEQMWLIFASIAMITPILLVVFRGWVGKDFKTKA
jgi:proton-dependent oligopeptide transporter, POT family